MLVLQLFLLLSLKLVCTADAGENLHSYYHKIVLRNVDHLGPCLIKKASVTIPHTFSPTVFCAQACLTQISCNLVCPKEATCDLYSLTDVLSVEPSWLLMTQGNLCYTTGPSPSEDHYRQPDLARDKPVSASPIFASHYNKKDSLVAGVTCNKALNSCYCSERVSFPFVIIDLGHNYTVTEVIVTLSSEWPTYFEDIKIKVGDSDAASEPVFDTFSSGGAVGETIIFTGHNSSIIGSKVIISSYPYASMCMCLVQVFGF